MSKKKPPSENILFISYHYPPDSQIGAKRISRLAEYFAKNGWEVGLLTVREKYHEKLDRSFKTQKVKEYRTSMFESTRFILRGIKKVAKGRISKQEKTALDKNGLKQNTERANGSAPAERKPGIISRLKKIVFSIVWCPDDRQGWILFGTRTLLKLAKRYRIIYSSGPPHSTHLIPLFARPFIRRTIWIAEFRDPWYSNPQPYFFSNRFTRWLDMIMEGAVVKKCDRIISVTAAMNEDFQKRYPGHAAKMSCFPNGFDRTAYPDLITDEDAGSGKLRFYHAGSFDYGRNPLPFLKALAELRQEGKLNESHVEVVFYGDCSADGLPVEEMISRLELDDISRCMGYHPWKTCIEEMYRSDVLLLFNIDQPMQVPAKLYEYMSAGKNILSISTGGITDRIIARTQTGKSVPPGDIPRLKRAILEFHENRQFHGKKEEIDKFDIEVIFSNLLIDVQHASEG